jgi:hypothetical protein
MEPTSNKESLLVFIIRICVMVTLGYILRASDQCARAFPPHSLEWTNTCMYMEASSEWACKTNAVAGSSDQAYLSAASWSLLWGEGGAAIRSCVEIIGKRNAITDTLQVDPAPSVHLRPPKRKRGNSTLKLSGKNDKFREQETRVVD